MANLEGKPCALIAPPGMIEPRIYGGVKNDLQWGGPFLLDTPLSAVADTLTIPLVIRMRRNPSTWKVDYDLLLPPPSDHDEDPDSVSKAHSAE